VFRERQEQVQLEKIYERAGRHYLFVVLLVLWNQVWLEVDLFVRQGLRSYITV
jgi:hypothetical protein